MKHARIISSVVYAAVALSVIAGCEKEFDLSTLPQLPDSVIDTAYVQLSPPFSGFVGAEGIAVGRDQLLYIADTRNNRVVMLNRAGQFMSARSVLHPRSISQDSKLDLLVGGEVVAANGDTAGAIFRFHLYSPSPDSAHRLEVSRVDTIWRELAKPARRFPGITVFGDNTYLAVRSGPDNSSFIDPDARVLQFNDNDVFVTPVPGLVTTVGTGIADINVPTGIASFPGVKDFVLIQSSQGVAYGAIWMTYQANTDFVGWLPKFDPAVPEQRGVDFIRPNRFALPRGVAIDPSRRDVFIADAALDSVFKFNSRGIIKGESFGLIRSGGTMQKPTGVAFFQQILYVLDGDQGLILRFRLTTDVPR